MPSQLGDASRPGLRRPLVTVRLLLFGCTTLIALALVGPTAAVAKSSAKGTAAAPKAQPSTPSAPAAAPHTEWDGEFSRLKVEVERLRKDVEALRAPPAVAEPNASASIL